MVKKSILERNKKKIILIDRYQEKRGALRVFVKRKDISCAERWEAYSRLHSMKRDSAAVRKKNRCYTTGRARGYYRKFGLSRIEMRRLCSSGCIPGVIKLSW